jgi:hypothetical protein
MEFRGLGRAYLLSTMVALAALTFSRQALAQIPEAPGTSQRRDGTTERGTGSDITTKPDAPTPGPARETINEMKRARERGGGTPEPEPTRKW